MKSQPKPTYDQLNLPLLKLVPVALPAGKDKELALALVELLVKAANSHSFAPLAKKGGANESEVDG
jgi:hypothetical protein